MAPERPAVDCDAAYVANTLSLCQRNDDLAWARAPKRKRGAAADGGGVAKRPRSLSATLADVDGVHLVDDIDAAHLIIGLLSA